MIIMIHIFSLRCALCSPRHILLRMFYLSQFILARIRPDLSAWPAATH